MIPLIPALGIVAASVVTGGTIGHFYGKSPSAHRDGVVDSVDHWISFFDRVGELPVEGPARFMVGLIADICFGDPCSPEVTGNTLREFVTKCRDEGLDDDAVTAWLKALTQNRPKALPHLA